MKRALIFGIGGQDGSYLADLLLAKGYEVWGTYRRSSVDNLTRIAHCRDRVKLLPAEITDYDSVFSTLVESEPDEVYNLADQDHVGYSENVPQAQLAVTAGGCANVLRAVQACCYGMRVFQPLSATMFGDAPPPQNESTPFNPLSPYAVAKVAAYYWCRYYRQHYELHVATAIFFNHDSPRRGRGYLLQKIARGEKLSGSLDTVVDIGFAGEYMEAAWNILQLPKPDDFVIGTGIGYTIEDLVASIYRPLATWESGLIADCTKARAAFGFDPTHDALSTLGLIKESLHANR